MSSRWSWTLSPSCIRENRKPGPDGVQGMRDLVIIDAIYRAAKSDRPVADPIPEGLMTKLGMGVVGVGTMGKRHAENIRRLIPEAQLIAVADADVVRARQVAAGFGD